MDLFLKACGAVLLTVIATLALGKNSKDYAVVLSVLACCLVALAAMEYVRPVLDFLSQLERAGGLDHAMIRILLKAAGIGLISEIAALVCSDSGNASLGKTIKLMGSAVILWLSLPLYTMLLELLQEILGAL